MIGTKETNNTVTIVGSGNVGKALFQVLKEHRRDVVLLNARTTHARGSLSGLVLLTVPDNHITAVCEKLLAQESFHVGAMIAHCSGALTSESLASARQLGHPTGSIHPLQTFPSPEQGALSLREAFFFCEGDDVCLRALLDLGHQLGRAAYSITPAAKVMYHLSAVIACNYFCALMDTAFSAAEQAGISRVVAQEAFAPLVEATLRNVFSHSCAQALTGPIARGDTTTIQKHVAALRAQNREDLLEVYAALGAATINLALKKGSIDQIQAKQCLEQLRAAPK